MFLHCGTPVVAVAVEMALLKQHCQLTFPRSLKKWQQNNCSRTRILMIFMRIIMQSTYRQHHHIETAIFCIQNDLLWSLNQKMFVAMVVIDLLFLKDRSSVPTSMRTIVLLFCVIFSTNMVCYFTSVQMTPKYIFPFLLGKRECR